MCSFGLGPVLNRRDRVGSLLFTLEHRLMAAAADFSQNGSGGVIMAFSSERT